MLVLNDDALTRRVKSQVNGNCAGLDQSINVHVALPILYCTIHMLPLNQDFISNVSALGSLPV